MVTTRQHIPSNPECESAAEDGVEADVEAEAVEVSTEYPIMGASDCVSLLKKAA